MKKTTIILFTLALLSQPMTAMVKKIVQNFLFKQAWRNYSGLPKVWINYTADTEIIERQNRKRWQDLCPNLQNELEKCVDGEDGWMERAATEERIKFQHKNANCEHCRKR